MTTTEREWTRQDIEKTAEQAAPDIISLPRFPFVSDEEADRVLPAKITSALRTLDSLNSSSGLCHQCGGKCCEQIKCVLYAPEFAGCPIFDCRPFVCRFSFCFRFGSRNKELVAALAGFALGIEAACNTRNPQSCAIDLNMMMYGECRQENDVLPPLVLDMRRTMRDARSSRISWQRARERLMAITAGYRAERRHSASTDGHSDVLPPTADGL